MTEKSELQRLCENLEHWETLFQPVMRYLKFEKFNNYVSHALPMMTAEKGGVFVVFKI